MKHPDESLALAALFDCWTPKWKTTTIGGGFLGDVAPALRAFGFSIIKESPFIIDREGRSGPTPWNGEEYALLLTPRQLYSPDFLYAFRRYVPSHIILAAKSCLWWAVWGQKSPPHPSFYISTAEFIPSRG